MAKRAKKYSKKSPMVALAEHFAGVQSKLEKQLESQNSQQDCWAEDAEATQAELSDVQAVTSAIERYNANREWRKRQQDARD